MHDPILQQLAGLQHAKAQLEQQIFALEKQQMMQEGVWPKYVSLTVRGAQVDAGELQDYGLNARAQAVVQEAVSVLTLQVKVTRGGLVTFLSFNGFELLRPSEPLKPHRRRWRPRIHARLSQ